MILSTLQTRRSFTWEQLVGVQHTSAKLHVIIIAYDTNKLSQLFLILERFTIRMASVILYLLNTLFGNAIYSSKILDVK